MPRPALAFHLFSPPSERPRPLLVTVHGVSTHPMTMIELMARAAADHGTSLMAPHFDDERFDDYQRLGSAPQPLQSADALAATLAGASQRTLSSAGKIDIMGFSGGAQFAHRFALFFPQLVRRVVIVSPGWYTFLDGKEPFPYGIGPAPLSRDRIPDLDAFLRIPKLVAVGELDTRRDAQLRRGRADAQGWTRLERAQRWVAHINEQSVQRGISARATLEMLPRTGHSVTEAVRKGGLADKMFSFLRHEAAPAAS